MSPFKDLSESKLADALLKLDPLPMDADGISRASASLLSDRSLKGDMGTPGLGSG
jgi:hypothetical protein